MNTHTYFTPTVTWRRQRDSRAGNVARGHIQYRSVVCAGLGNRSSARICGVYGHGNVGQCRMRWSRVRRWQHFYSFWVWKPAK